MEEELDESALEKGLNMMRMYDEFDDCRHLVDDMLAYCRQNKVRSFNMEVSIELAYADYLEQKGKIGRAPDYDERLRKLKVDALTSARQYLEDMVCGRRSR